MRSRAFAFGCLASASLGAASMFGCVDLFHRTDFEEPSAGTAAFCSLSEDAAKSQAERACAYLSACQSPLGENAAGECLVNATLAYDCSANPNMLVTGKAKAFWSCMGQVASCADVKSCVYSDPPAKNTNAEPPQCNAGATNAFTACGGESNGARVDCQSAGAAALGESCFESGRGCVAKQSGGEALCLGGEGVTCNKTGCNGTQLDFCVDAGGGDLFDRGIDCASFGAGECVPAKDDDAGADGGIGIGPGCLPVDGGACPPQPGIQCIGAIAQACATGIQEKVNCAALADGVNCTPNANAPAWDVAAACVASTPKCGTDACSQDAKSLVACVRGSTRSIDCGALGLGACQTFITSDGPRAACSPPQ